MVLSFPFKLLILLSANKNNFFNSLVNFIIFFPFSEKSPSNFEIEAETAYSDVYKNVTSSLS